MVDLTNNTHPAKRAFIRIIARVLSAYEDELAKNGETDFEDMIGKSARAVATGAWASPFTHVLVDEFHDISPLRAHFVRAFQSAESRATIFAPSLTHRFSAALADASGQFVLKNPTQIRKTVRGRPSDVERPITLIRTDATTSAAGLRRDRPRWPSPSAPSTAPRGLRRMW